MMPIAMMLRDEGDDGDAKKSDAIALIYCITNLQNDNFGTSCLEMAQCSITTLKKAVYDEGWEATSIPVLKQRIKE